MADTTNVDTLRRYIAQGKEETRMRRSELEKLLQATAEKPYARQAQIVADEICRSWMGEAEIQDILTEVLMRAFADGIGARGEE